MKYCNNCLQLVEPEKDFNGDGSKSSNIFEQLPDCEKDNITHWMKDSSFVYTEGVTKCDVENEDLIFSGTWFFNEAETRFTEMFYDNNILTLEREVMILLLTPTHLSTRYEVEDDSTIYSLTFNYIHP